MTGGAWGVKACAVLAGAARDGNEQSDRSPWQVHEGGRAPRTPPSGPSGSERVVDEPGPDCAGSVSCAGGARPAGTPPTRLLRCKRPGVTARDTGRAWAQDTGREAVR